MEAPVGYSLPPQAAGIRSGMGVAQSHDITLATSTEHISLLSTNVRIASSTSAQITMLPQFSSILQKARTLLRWAGLLIWHMLAINHLQMLRVGRESKLLLAQYH